MWIFHKWIFHKWVFNLWGMASFITGIQLKSDEVDILQMMYNMSNKVSLLKVIGLPFESDTYHLG